MTFVVWLRGTLRHRPGRLLGTAAGVAIAVASLASVAIFLAQSKATMTRRAIAGVPVDWQVETQPGADPRAVLATVRAFPATATAVPVGVGTTSGFEATTAGSVQTTGSGLVLGLPATYRQTFPGEVRDLVGSGHGVLVAQQTAANLHVAPGDRVSIGRAGLAAVTLTVDGVVELPLADSLFQKVGAPAGSQPQAPPDNVVLVPMTTWHSLFDPLAANRPDLVREQVHTRLDHRLPADPSAAYGRVTGLARNLEVRLAGSGLVGDNLGATLDQARQDALYAQLLFLFLGLPGAALAAVLTATVASSGAERRRREQGLLRARGMAAPSLVRLAVAEALAAGVVGSAVGLLVAAGVGRVAFGSASFGAGSGAAVAWASSAAVAGVAIALGAVVGPAVRDARAADAAARPQRWLRWGLDVWVLAAAGLVFWATSRSGYQLVLAPEGVPGISVDYWAFAGPALLWVGGALVAWRIGDVILRRGDWVIARLAAPVAGSLAGAVAASMRRQHRLLARSLVVVALTVSFAASTAIFNETYKHQAEVDARLTNGADVTVTEPPTASVGAGFAARLAQVPGVRSVEPLQHRFAYVGADLQDLYGVRASTIVKAASLQNAYVAGGSVQQLMDDLAAQADGVLVSAETVHDFQLRPGDRVTLRLQDSRTKQLRDVVFHYIGVAKEFPTAPRDSFLVANAGYLARATGSDAVGTFLIDTGRSSSAVAADVRRVVGTGAVVSDIDTTRRIVGSSLTAVDLGGLTRVELGFALVLAAAATGLVLALGLAERRRTFAVLHALGASRRQVAGFLWTEGTVVTVGGLVTGAVGAWALSWMLVKVLTGVFDPAPAGLVVPWPYLATTASLAVVATAVAIVVYLAVSRPSIQLLRES